MKWLLIAMLSLVCLTGIMALLGSRLPLAHTADRSIRFGAPPEKVWGVLDDAGGMPSWRSDLKSVELLPPRDGKRVHREVWTNGRVIEMERTESRPPERMTARIATRDLPFQGGWTYELTPDGGGTILKITENGEIANPMARFVVYYFVGYTATIDKYLADLAKKLGAS